MALPIRKSPRIPGYDYSTPNYYFITVCTHNKSCIFGKPGKLNQFGIIAERNMQKIPEIYPNIGVDKFVIMPNHVHVILTVAGLERNNVIQAIGQYKMSVTRQIHGINPGMNVWQRSFHDHVIRNQKQYDKIWEYIENNPLKWDEDCFYIANFNE